MALRAGVLLIAVAAVALALLGGGADAVNLARNALPRQPLLPVPVRLLPLKVYEAVDHMRTHPDDRAVQIDGCYAFTAVPSNCREAQNEALLIGAIDAAVAAQNRFPDDVQLQVICTGGVSSMILFNRHNGLRAGGLGGLNRTLATYARGIEDPRVNTLGGAIGAYFDDCTENRAIARDLGGPQLFIRNIRNNFHGKLGEWNYEPVKQSLFALSSGSWYNEDIVASEGFLELAVQLMREHGQESKIAEESLQALKALMHHDDRYRTKLSQLGGAAAILHVMEVSQHDRGAVDLACESLAVMVGPRKMYGPVEGMREKAFDPEIQATVTKAGAVEQLLTVILGKAEMKHAEHEAFNFDVDASYNTNRDCYAALATLAVDHAANQDAMRGAGLPAHLEATLPKTPYIKHEEEWINGCALLHKLSTDKPLYCAPFG